jgi:hypothetical protein
MIEKTHLTVERRLATLEGMMKRLATALQRLEKASVKSSRREHRALLKASQSVVTRFERRRRVARKNK